MTPQPKRWWKALEIPGLLVLCAFLVWLGVTNPGLITGSSASTSTTNSLLHLGGSDKSDTLHPLIELLKLVLAACIGMMLASLHKRFKPEKALTRSVEQSLTLLCVTGAMMMIIIGTSLPRALGIAGGAGIIRFRTPVKDTKDATIFFLLLGLGMACGIGAFAVAGLGALFVGGLLFALDRFAEERPRNMWLTVVAPGSEFPMVHVRNVFAPYRATLDPRNWTLGEDTTVRFAVIMSADTPMSDITKEIVAAGPAAVKSVFWEPVKKSKGKEEEDDDWF